MRALRGVNIIAYLVSAGLAFLWSFLVYKDEVLLNASGGLKYVLYMMSAGMIYLSVAGLLYFKVRIALYIVITDMVVSALFVLASTVFAEFMIFSPIFPIHRVLLGQAPSGSMGLWIASRVILFTVYLTDAALVWRYRSRITDEKRPSL